MQLISNCSYITAVMINCSYTDTKNDNQFFVCLHNNLSYSSLNNINWKMHYVIITSNLCAFLWWPVCMNTVHDPLVQAMYGFPTSYTVDIVVSIYWLSTKPCTVFPYSYPLKPLTAAGCAPWATHKMPNC